MSDAPTPKRGRMGRRGASSNVTTHDDEEEGMWLDEDAMLQQVQEQAQQQEEATTALPQAPTYLEVEDMIRNFKLSIRPNSYHMQ